MVAQLLASEGFTSVEEVAYVDADEVAAIEGFDEETAGEIQARAREFLERQEAEHDARRVELGVEDSLRAIDGLTTPMLVALGEDGVKSLEDFAGCAADDLVGWSERKDGETKRFPGALSPFEVSRQDAETMIMQARVQAGWVTAEELQPAPEAEEEVAEEL